MIFVGRGVAMLSVAMCIICVSVCTHGAGEQDRGTHLKWRDLKSNSYSTMPVDFTLVLS